MKTKYPGKKFKSLIARNIATGNKASTKIMFNNPDKAAQQLKKFEEEYLPEEWI